MNPPSELIRQMIVQAEFGTEPTESGQDWHAFTSFLPELPDNAICVYDTSGKFDGREMREGTQIEHEGIMVWVRSTSYAQGWVKANAIAKMFDILNNALVTYDPDDESAPEYYRIQNISRTGPIQPLGVDEIGSKRRHEFSINALLTVFLLDEPEGVPFYLSGRPYYVQS